MLKTLGNMSKESPRLPINPAPNQNCQNCQTNGGHRCSERGASFRGPEAASGRGCDHSSRGSRAFQKCRTRSFNCIPQCSGIFLNRFLHTGQETYTSCMLALVKILGPGWPRRSTTPKMRGKKMLHSCSMLQEFQRDAFHCTGSTL